MGSDLQSFRCDIVLDGLWNSPDEKFPSKAKGEHKHPTLRITAEGLERWQNG